MTNDEKVRRFEKALAYAGNTHNIADVLDRIGQQKAVCWTHGDTVVVTEVLAFPRRRVCNYWIVAGTLKESTEMQPDINAWAVSEGCSTATATGRMGWLHVTRTMPLGAGWIPRGIKFVKQLSHD